jgi:hypothetical protein
VSLKQTIFSKGKNKMTNNVLKIKCSKCRNETIVKIKSISKLEFENQNLKTKIKYLEDKNQELKEALNFFTNKYDENSKEWWNKF